MGDPERRRRDEEPIGYDGLWSAAALYGGLWGLGVFVLLTALMGIDYFEVRGVPTERITIVSIESSGTMESCGAKSLWNDTPGERTTYRSANPPPGMAAEFAITHCPWPEDKVGDVTTARRTGAGTSFDDFYPGPIETVGQWLGMAALGGLMTTAVMVVVGLMKGWWEVRDARRDQERRRSRRGNITA
ncbi:hypothetical protein N802_06215 [Knoellia sinensis KCTC 19936]|uniref:DUF3592 domain-containing protein n=2 Tax=Knoellia TaxID=136099 RepID=A0A0A0J026_9MICO|nr:hypothetical protein N802_06215 [Knoellia sinensis KCTC 19936]